MPGIKKRGIESTQNKRFYKGKEVRPTRWVHAGGRTLMTGTIIETDEVVKDENGKPVPWMSIN